MISKPYKIFNVTRADYVIDDPSKVAGKLIFNFCRTLVDTDCSNMLAGFKTVN